MSKRIYVGNISYQMDDAELRELFEQYGEVVYASVVTDRETGRSRGFAFVEMETEQAAEAAINALNGSTVGGRQLKIAEARPRQQRSERSYGGYNRDRNDGRSGDW